MNRFARAKAREKAKGARFEPRAVYDGTKSIGAVTASVGGFLARDGDGRSLGGFGTMAEAMRAVLEAAGKAP